MIFGEMCLTQHVRSVFFTPGAGHDLGHIDHIDHMQRILYNVSSWDVVLDVQFESVGPAI